MQKREPSHTIGGNENQYSHYGKQCGDFLKNWIQNCYMTQQSHCWEYTPRKPELEETRGPQCSSQHCLRQPGHGSNLARCPLTDKWIRKLWYIYAIKYLSAIKKNAFESVLMRWMKLEPIIQNEVSQKVKHQYSILMHIHGIQKDGNDDPISERKRDTVVKNRLLDSVGECKGGMI